MSGKVTSDPSRRRDVAARGNRNVGALAEEHARAPTSLLVPSRNALDARSFPRRADSLIFRYSRHRMHNESASLPVGKKAFGLERRFWSPSQDRVQFSLLRQHLIEILAEKKRVRGSLEKAAT
jgi:hypothetical protein